MAGVVVASAVGWVGGQAVPAEQVQAAADVQTATTTALATSQTGTRDRAAWQPSPVPSSVGAVTTPASTATDATAPVQAIQPAGPQGLAVPVVTATGDAVAGTARPLSLLARLHDWLQRLLSRAVPASPSVEALPGTDSVIPMTDLLDHDTLEAMFGGGLPATRGEWRQVSFYSQALGRVTTYLAWLPPGYATSGERYPTLYLLHGVGSAEAYGVGEWLGYALTEDLDRMLALGLIEPMIVVLPDGEQGYWMNHADGGPQWADFVAADLVRHVDASFRTDATREKRAIGGLSMGGHGAVQIAYNHPDLFSAAGAHSPTVRSYETSPEFFGDPAHFAQYDPVSLARGTSAAAQVLTWIDVGAEDTWRAGARALRDTLTLAGAPVEYRVLEGEHEGWYWKHYLPEYLGFYSEALHTRHSTPSGAPVVAGTFLTAAAGFASAGA